MIDCIVELVTLDVCVGDVTLLSFKLEDARLHAVAERESTDAGTVYLHGHAQAMLFADVYSVRRLTHDGFGEPTLRTSPLIEPFNFKLTMDIARGESPDFNLHLSWINIILAHDLHSVIKRFLVKLRDALPDPDETVGTPMLEPEWSAAAKRLHSQGLKWFRENISAEDESDAANETGMLRNRLGLPIVVRKSTQTSAEKRGRGMIGNLATARRDQGQGGRRTGTAAPGEGAVVLDGEFLALDTEVLRHHSDVLPLSVEMRLFDEVVYLPELPGPSRASKEEVVYFELERVTMFRKVGHRNSAAPMHKMQMMRHQCPVLVTTCQEESGQWVITLSSVLRIHTNIPDCLLILPNEKQVQHGALLPDGKRAPSRTHLFVGESKSLGKRANSVGSLAGFTGSPQPSRERLDSSPTGEFGSATTMVCIFSTSLTVVGSTLKSALTHFRTFS